MAEGKGGKKNSKISVRLSEDVKTKLRKAAKFYGVPMSWIINKLLTDKKWFVDWKF